MRKEIVNVTIDPSTLGGPLSSVWLIYTMTPMLWRDKEFKKHYPDEAVYRHSLAEESESLRTALDVVKNQKIPNDKLDPTLKSLVALDKDGMLECWILLNGADAGVAKDYAAYRGDSSRAAARLRGQICRSLQIALRVLLAFDLGGNPDRDRMRRGRAW